MSVTYIKIEGMDELLKKLDPAILKPVVTDGLTEVGVIAGQEIQRRTPVFTGLLANSITVVMDPAHWIPEYVRIGPRRPHTHLVEFGVQPHFPPWLAEHGKGARRLRRWVRQTLQPQPSVRKRVTKEERKDAREAALDRATFLVARGIAQRGVRARYFIRDAFHTVEGQIESVVSGMVAHLEGEWEKIGGPLGG